MAGIITVVNATAGTGVGAWSPTSGDHTQQLGSHLVASKMLESIEEFMRIRDESRRILSQVLSPKAEAARRTGIVVGYVQSGKTVSMTTVAALARDNGFRIIIAVSGTTKNLFDQSRERFERDLRGSEIGHRTWVILANPTQSANRRDISRLVNEWSSGVILAEDQQALFIVVMKHYQHIAELAALLSLVDLAGVNALVIDDEADQAGLNTAASSGANPSTTYRQLAALRSSIPRHTYLQYTATPQAPLLISLADMLSPEFADVLQPGELYTGGRTFFLERPQLVCQIPSNDLATAGDALEPPPSLVTALQIYFVGAVASMIDSRGERFRSMLVHPSRLTAPQGQFVTWVERITDRWRRILALSPEDEERRRLLEEFLVAHRSLIGTDPRIAPFADLVPRMPIVAHRIIVTEVNSETGHEVDWKKGTFHILIGGEKMSRGYTVRGLTVTYMPRPPGTWTADTIQQRARWFGYKSRYVGQCRVFLPSDMIGAYQSYVSHEENIRSQLRDFRGRPLREWRRAFFLDAPYRATRQNVLSSPLFRFPAPAGWFEQESPHYSLEMIESNRQALRQFVDQISFVAHPQFSDRHRIVEGIRVRALLDGLLMNYGFLGAHDARGAMATICRLSELVADQPDATCTLIKIDAQRPPRNRTARNNAQSVDLHQGRDPRGNGYPGDAAIHAAEGPTVQIHTIMIDIGDVDGATIDNVPALAIYLPPSMTGDVIVQPG